MCAHFTTADEADGNARRGEESESDEEDEYARETTDETRVRMAKEYLQRLNMDKVLIVAPLPASIHTHPTHACMPLHVLQQEVLSSDEEDLAITGALGGGNGCNRKAVAIIKLIWSCLLVV